MSELGELVDGLVTPTFDTRRFVAAGRDLAASQGSLPATIRALAADALAAANTAEGNLPAALESLAVGYLDQIDQAQRYLNQTLMHQATHDPLTGLPNRTALISRLSAAKSRVGVCYIDLDGFKKVNDEHGHDAGDTLLCTIAERIGRVAAEHGALAARIGGDEFLVLAEQYASAPALARDILDEIRLPVPIPGGELQVTACAGIAVGTATSLNASVVADADAALYRAKASGRGRWVIHEPVPADRTRTPVRSMAVSIRTGLERGEFGITYLPVVDLSDGHLRAARAMPVWRHPSLGDLTASVFLPLAEGTPAAAHLTSWLLETTAADAAAWPGLPVSVALPASQRVQPAAPTYLEFSESALATPLPVGVRLVITDFGKGTSGLSRLRDLPVAGVVLHRDLTSPPDGALLEPLVSLARRAGATVVAADVTDSTQASLLRRIGCDAASGPLFSEPVTAARLRQMAQARERAAALSRFAPRSRPRPRPRVCDISDFPELSRPALPHSLSPRPPFRPPVRNFVPPAPHFRPPALIRTILRTYHRKPLPVSASPSRNCH
ncbi:MAG: EAL domain-containing protein [Streptosporangiaceae bacterium]